MENEQNKPFYLKTGLPINKVVDPEYQKIDNERSSKVFKKLYEGSQGSNDDKIVLDDADCSMVIAMLQSPEYLNLIVRTTDLSDEI